jgi:hypothetical protein
MAGMRGRLIHQFTIELAQLDTRATEDVLDGGYDPVFGEPRRIADGTQTGAPSRRETRLTIEAQVDPSMFNAARTLAGGQVREARLTCIVHYRDLERRGLIDLTGSPKIRVGDRLVAVRDRQGHVVLPVPDPPGLYLRQTLPRSFGYGGKVNLLELEFLPRSQAR